MRRKNSFSLIAVFFIFVLNLLLVFSCTEQKQKLFSEFFDDVSLQAWSPTTWKVAENEKQQLASDGKQPWILSGDPEWTDVAIEADIHIQSDMKPCGLLGRYQDSTHYYLLCFEEGYLFLKHHTARIGGSIYSIQPGESYKLKLVQRGGLISAWVNDEFVFKVHDYKDGIPRLASGKMGLFAEGRVVFDNITVTKESPYSLEPIPAPAFQTTKFRKAVSLNGLWQFTPDGKSKTTLRVPDVWEGAPGYDGLKSAVYETTFDVPDDYLPVIQLEFEAVNDYAQVYINENLVGEHKGKDLRFALDISNAVKPGSKDNHLKVRVSELDEYHPHGWWRRKFGESNLGIRGHVWLTSYPAVYVEDVFVKTSTRKNEITIFTTLRNSDGGKKSISLQHLIRGQDGRMALSFALPQIFVINANSDTTVSWTQKWEDAHLWWPDDPYLYTLQSRLYENKKLLDEDQECFGFREVWTEGTQYKLNGIRLNLRGDSVVDHGIRIANVIYASVIDHQQEGFYDYFMTREGMEKAVEGMLDMNFNTVRTHMGPALQTFYEVCDEKGLMITCETDCYGSGMYNDYPEDECQEGPDGKSLMENTNQWIKEFVKQFKNHPSIVMWSASNEAQARGRNDCWDLDALTQMLKAEDDTRLVIHHRDQLSEDGYVFHYTYSHNTPDLPDNLYTNNRNQKAENAPSGEGEFFWVYDWRKYNGGAAEDWRQKVKGQGYLTRGYRYDNYAYIRPYRMNWGWKWKHAAGWNLHEQYEIIQKSMAAVAVYDKEYDDLYDNLLEPPDLPTVKAGSLVNRTLIVYNDEFHGEEVHIKWQARIDKKIIDSGTFTEKIPLGEYLEKSIDIKIPVGQIDKKMVLALQSFKDGELKYQDDTDYMFLITEN